MLTASRTPRFSLLHSTAAATVAGTLLAATAGCSGDDDVGSDTQNETWNRSNNPAYVDPNFEYDVSKLPVQGAAALAPIPAHYWPTYEDSVNVKWDGAETLSPAGKYAQAFGRSGLEDVVSSRYGIDRYRGSRKECSTNGDCDDLDDGSSCSRRNPGDAKGVCIPTWWGICHGWAPYAISEPAAAKEVVHNGVTFYPGDLEALMSLAYTSRLPVKFISERCNENKPAPGEDGRVADGECRDMNPGSLHIIAANMLGIRKQGIVEDRTWDLQVWNQPVSGFRITNTVDGKLLEVTKEQAVALVGLPAGSDYRYNTDAQRFFHVVMELDWVREASPSHQTHCGESYYTQTDTYEYVLEVDGQGKVFGGEYVGASRTFHPDFMWWPTSKPQGTVADGLITYDEVKMLNDMAVASE